MENKKSGNELPFWLMPAISWIFAVYFLVVFHLSTGIPPKNVQNTSDWVMLALGLIFVILPFLKKIKVGDIFELERQVREVEKGVNDFKQETRNTLLLLSSTVNTISNLSNTVNVNLPGYAELEAAKRDVREISQGKNKEQAAEIKQELLLDGEDIIMPLARTRIRIEQLLRKILNKSQISSKQNDKDIKFMSASQLFGEFNMHYPAYDRLIQPFRYVNQVCNAAIHGQRISAGEASEALDLGVQIIAVLSDI
jgi:hypothetical protein